MWVSWIRSRRARNSAGHAASCQKSQNTGSNRAGILVNLCRSRKYCGLEIRLPLRRGRRFAAGFLQMRASQSGRGLACSNPVRHWIFAPLKDSSAQTLGSVWHKKTGRARPFGRTLPGPRELKAPESKRLLIVLAVVDVEYHCGERIRYHRHRSRRMRAPCVLSLSASRSECRLPSQHIQHIGGQWPLASTSTSA